MIKVSPSLLSCDFSIMYDELESIKNAGADMVHLDVMDGVFVNNISFGMPIISSLRRRSDMFFDTHLMIVEPEKFVERFAQAGSDLITFHIEATKDPLKLIDMIHSYGVKAGVSICPSTPIEDVFGLLDKCDLILIMTVNPGHGGQKLIPETLEKVKTLRSRIDELSVRTLIEVDGGVNDETAKCAISSGADILVAGSYVFEAQDRKAAIDALKQKS